MRRRLALILIALTGLASSAGLLIAGPALAAGSGATLAAPNFSLNNAPQVSDTTTQTTAATSSSSSSSSGGGLSRGDAILIGVITAAVLIGIAAYVMRDARQHTRNNPDVDDDPFAIRRRGSKAPQKSRKLTPAERKRRKRGRAPRRV